MTPRLSVIIRSFNRLPALCELVTALLAQQHDSFEIVVVEQSTDTPADASARLAELEQDPRLRVLRIRPLGGAAARNKGVELMRGEIAVFIDDDDVPIGTDFLTSIEAAFRDDPKLVGLTCRHVWSDSDKLSWAYRLLAPRLAMRFSRVLGLPDNFARYDHRLAGRDYVHGTGGAYRRTIFERFGGWDEDTPIEDETSLGIRVKRGLTAGEYIAFDPRARLRRGFDLAGGLDKRRNTAGSYYARFMRFVHAILGRYYPRRVRWLYPLYVFGAWRFTLGWLWDDSMAHDNVPKKLLGTLLFTLAMPYHALKAVRVPFGSEPGSGIALRERLGKAPRVAAAARRDSSAVT